MEITPKSEHKQTERTTSIHKKKKKFSSLFFGIKKLPVKHTLKLIPSEESLLEHYFPIAVDFGITSIKIVQIGIVEEKPQIVKLIIEELPLELWNSPLQRKEAMGKIFKDLVEKHQLKGEVVTSLPSYAVQMKPMKLPPLPLEEIYPAVQWELKQTSTIPLENLTFDYYILGDYHPESSKELNVMVISCSKHAVFDQMEIIKNANLTPIAIETDPLAAVSALIHSSQITKDSVSLFLEIGCHSCSINIVKDNQVYFKRDLEINGNLLTLGIVKQCRVNYEKAERLKKELGLITPTRQTQVAFSPGQESAIMVNETLWLHMEDLIQDIDYTFKYFTHQFTEGEVRKCDQIVLSGGTALLNNFPYYLNSYLGIPVKIADPLGEISCASEIKEEFNNCETLLPRLSVAIGLAIREMKK